MPSPDLDGPPQGGADLRPTVFLSYASEDRLAAQALRDALPLLGLEVWYDEAEPSGGDAWGLGGCYSGALRRHSPFARIPLYTFSHLRKA